MTTYEKPSQYRITSNNLYYGKPELKELFYVQEMGGGPFLAGNRPAFASHYESREEVTAALQAEGYREVQPGLFQAEGEAENLSDLFS
jgi:hypothetical protein